MSAPPGLLLTPEGIHVLAHDSHSSRWVEEHKRLDIAAAQIALFAHLIQPGGTVIDAGASIGDHTATYANIVGPEGKVIAIEPHPLAFKALALNFASHKNVPCLNVALGSRSDRLRFHAELNAGASHISNAGKEIVQVITIDSLDLSRLDFVHLDCEGSEPFVLQGARQTLQKFHPNMVIEINHETLARFGATEKTVCKILAELGYEWHEMEAGFGPDMGQRDLICVKKK